MFSLYGCLNEVGQGNVLSVATFSANRVTARSPSGETERTHREGARDGCLLGIGGGKECGYFEIRRDHHNIRGGKQ